MGCSNPHHELASLVRYTDNPLLCNYIHFEVGVSEDIVVCNEHFVAQVSWRSFGHSKRLAREDPARHIQLTTILQ
jgi:hypothetical protein